MDQSPRPLCSITETCRILHVGRTTIYKLMKDGELETMLVGSRRLVFEDSIKSYQERQARAEEKRLVDRKQNKSKDEPG